MTQTLADVEFIFVNDSTPDDSINILQSVLDQYPERKSDVTILTHTENKGLPSARNTGLQHAKGEILDITAVQPVMQAAFVHGSAEIDDKKILIFHPQVITRVRAAAMIILNHLCWKRCVALLRKIILI